MVTLTKYQVVTIVTVTVLAIVQWLGIRLGIWTLTDVLSVIPYFLFTAMFGVFLWGLGKNIENALGKKTAQPPEEIEDKQLKMAEKSGLSTFSSLTVHYAQKTNNPDTLINSAQPKYVTNNLTKEAFLVPSWLKPYVRQRKISPQSHDGERKLDTFLKAYGGSRTREPLPEELGLRFEGDKLIRAETSDTLTKLKGHTLEDLRIIILKRFYHKERTLLWNRTMNEVFMLRLLFRH
jgi:hypothetical protein